MKGKHYAAHLIPLNEISKDFSCDDRCAWRAGDLRHSVRTEANAYLPGFLPRPVLIELPLPAPYPHDIDDQTLGASNGEEAGWYFL